MNTPYVKHHGIRSGEMTLAIDVEGEERPRKKIPAKVMWYAPIMSF